MTTSSVNSIRYCLQPNHLRWTLRIGLFMGIIYTIVNQGDVIAEGKANWLLWIKIPLNFLAPFIVANIGLLGARRDQTSR